MAIVLPASAVHHHDMNDFYYDPLRLRREIFPRSRKSWQDDFGYVMHPLRNIQRSLENASDSAAVVDKIGFHVCIDVHQFQPEEITLKTDDRYITIEGKHEERQDEHGFIMRQFARRYELPEGYDSNHVTSELSADGILTIKAPKPLHLGQNERQIAIQHTGTAHYVTDVCEKIKPLSVN